VHNPGWGAPKNSFTEPGMGMLQQLRILYSRHQYLN